MTQTTNPSPEALGPALNAAQALSNEVKEVVNRLIVEVTCLQRHDVRTAIGDLVAKESILLVPLPVYEVDHCEQGGLALVGPRKRVKRTEVVLSPGTPAWEDYIESYGKPNPSHAGKKWGYLAYDGEEVPGSEIEALVVNSLGSSGPSRFPDYYEAEHYAWYEYEDHAGNPYRNWGPNPYKYAEADDEHCETDDAPVPIGVEPDKKVDADDSDTSAATANSENSKVTPRVLPKSLSIVCLNDWEWRIANEEVSRREAGRALRLV